VQHNIEVLTGRGVHIVPPEEGRLAGGDVGAGRLASPVAIVDAVIAALTPPDLAGLSVLVTAGGTREPIDPVRFIGNRSSGKQGHALADEAAARGAKVTVVTTVDRPTPAGATVLRVDTAAEMLDAVLSHSGSADVVVMAAAVADFRPSAPAASKIKKAKGIPDVVLEPTPDVLVELGQRKTPGQIIVGFAAETEDVVEGARNKLIRKGADFIVANDVSAPGAGFEHDTNEVVIVSAAGIDKDVGLTDKRAVARAVFDAVVAARRQPARVPVGPSTPDPDDRKA